MLREIDRRILKHQEALSDRLRRGLSRDNETSRIRGQLEECERLRAFYVEHLQEVEAHAFEDAQEANDLKG